MLPNCVMDKPEILYIDSISQNPDIRNRLTRFAKLRSNREDSIFSYAYRFGSCDIFPLWYISSAISYMKETGDYGLMEEVKLQEVFNAFSSFSGDFAGILSLFREDRRLATEDAVTIALYLFVCTDYLELCRYLDLPKEAVSADIRLKWISDLDGELSRQFEKEEWLPCIQSILNVRTGRKGGSCNGFTADIDQFVRSGVFEILRLYNRKNAQKYWLSNSSAWNRKATAEMVFGIRPGFYGLSIRPCLPEAVDRIEIKRYFRNAVYDICVKSPRHEASDIQKLVVDNAEYLGNLLPNFADGKTHKVEVILGSFD